MKTRPNVMVKVQKFGTFLSGMVMPNIGAFIAWGLLTALFIPTGWLPNEDLGNLVGPTLKYLMPILIGYTGGTMIHGSRGGVAGALATIGVVIGSEVTMLIGGMVMGPLGAYAIKRVDKLLAGKVKTGMEMLVDNFSLGIVGAIIMCLGYITIGPIFHAILKVISGGVQILMDHNLLALTSIFVQPAQVLFLNNAVNHGIMIPIGIEQAATTGKSILFLVEANGAVWVGVVMAFAIWGRGMAKKSAPAAGIIMFFGGIAEVTFPYVLMKPKTIIAPILANMAALLTLQLLDGGTVAAVSPGSFLALLAMTPKGAFIANLAGYFVAFAVAMTVTGLILKLDKTPLADDEEDDDETEEIAENSVEAETASVNANTIAQGAVSNLTSVQHIQLPKTVKTIVFACDAGMGSSVMASSMMKTKVSKALLDIEVKHTAIQNFDGNADVIITSALLAERVQDTVNKFGKTIPIIPMKNLINGKIYDELVKKLKDNA